MNKLSLFLCLLVCPSIYKLETTYAFKCADELKIDTCYLEAEVKNGEDTVVTCYMKACPKNKKCTLVESTNGEDYCHCVKVKEYIKDGDSCLFNKECQSGNCVNKKCAYIEDGEKCSSARSCNKKSSCNYFNGFRCTPLSNKNEQCNSSNDCGFGLLCNKEINSSICTEMFSLEDGKESSEDFLCASGRRYNGKCATTKTVNSNCTESDTCQISVIVGGNEQTVSQKCEEVYFLGNSEMACPLQSNTQQMKDYIKLYKNEREKMDQNDIDKIHVGNMEDEDRFTLNSNKKVLEAYVNLHYYKIIGDNDCIRDFFISEQKANKNQLSILIMLFFSLLMI